MAWCSVGGSYEFKSALIEAISQSESIKLYFPSELGLDHTVHDFSAPEWEAKKIHYSNARKLLEPKHIKLCRVYTGLFLEESIGPWFGFYTKKGKYEIVGSSDSKTAYTSLKDVGLAMASLAAMSVESVPEEVRLAGDNISPEEIARIMQEAGAGRIELTSIPLTEYKFQVVNNAESKGTADFIRFIMGEGKGDHGLTGLGNSNDIVNEGESIWVWKKIRDLAAETSGRPWADYEWPGE